MERGNDYLLARRLKEIVDQRGIIPMSLIDPLEKPLFDKYDEYLPIDLLHKAFAADKLDPIEAEDRIYEIFSEYSE